MGEFFAILNSIFWALSVVLFKLSGDKKSSIILNTYKTTIASIFFIITLIILGQLSYFWESKFIDIFIFFISSLFGMAIADTLFYKSLKHVGAGVIAIIEASQPAFIMILAYTFYGEKLFIKDYIGALLICTAIILSSYKKKQRLDNKLENQSKSIQENNETVLLKNDTNSKVIKLDFIKGLIIGLFSIFLMSVCIIIIKYPFIVNYSVLEKYPPMFSSAIRVIVSSIFLSPICLLNKYRSSYLNLYNLKPKTNRIILIASITGGYLSLLFWIYGIKLVTNVSIAIILNKLSTVFIIIFAALLLKEKITIYKILAMIFALSGCFIILM